VTRKRRLLTATASVVLVLGLCFTAACGSEGSRGGGGLTNDERTALDSAAGSYLSQIDKAGKNATGTAYGACSQAASDYPIAHRGLFARAFAKRVQFANGKGKRKADLRSVCLAGLALGGDASG
jgi:hypothetical protein